MIWIATLCLLCVATWLILSGMNERRWVHDHLHDESVAADPGFVPDMSRVSARANAIKSKLSLEDDNTPLSRAVNKAQASSSAVGARLGSAARAARVDETQQLKYSGRSGAAYLGAAAARVGVNTDDLGQKVRQRASTTLAAGKGRPGIVGKMAGGVSTWVDKGAARRRIVLPGDPPAGTTEEPVIITDPSGRKDPSAP